MPPSRHVGIPSPAPFLPAPNRDTIRTMRMPLTLLLLLAATVGNLHAQTDSTWRQHSAASDTAYARGDFASARTHTLMVDQLLGSHPTVVMTLARIAARQNDTAEVFAQIGRVAAMGVTTRRLADPAFASIRETETFRRLAAQINGNAATIGTAEVVAVLPDSETIAEDLAWDPERSRFIVTNMRRRRLQAVGVNGEFSDLGMALPPGWGLMGAAVDAPRGVVWVTAVTLPQVEGYTRADSGRSAILRVDIASRSIQRRFDLPSPSTAAPGDIAIAENHDVFVGDGQAGAIYVIRSGRDSLETLVPAGRFRATQQPAFAPDRRTLFIPDYGRGIARVDRRDGRVLGWLSYPPGVTMTGFDGLLMWGRDLVGVQNGVVPNRIVRLVLDEAMTGVVRSEVLLRDSTLADEPTHVALANGVLYAIGNAGWNRFNDDGSVNPNVRPRRPAILRLR